MLMPKKARVAICLYLFKEGVLVAEKNTHLPKHPTIDVPNLYVINLMRSMKSRGFVRESFCWNHYYWYLTNEGIIYLREFLHLPEEIVPATLKKSRAPRQATPGDQATGGPRSGPPGAGGPPSGKDVGPGSGFRPSFQSDRPFGRGAGGPGGGRGRGGQRGDYYRAPQTGRGEQKS
eukprot:TRINITY_DN44_c0_g2_i1.p1 TRINITY_DN44_c0_g2~~TRINITY_DN44_c0_g2_i1.p1  ORF type:complete len:176 (-),score=41.08 TRINITY_DN44_c0_g2_i1:85-612(-)